MVNFQNALLIHLINFRYSLNCFQKRWSNCLTMKKYFKIQFDKYVLFYVLITI